MLILAVDTSGTHGSIALTRFEAVKAHTLEIVPLEGGTFSAQLVPQISSLLAKHGFTKSDIDGFAVASGPGSFTGLRVGLAAIKGLSEILRKPIAAVSLLEAIAFERIADAGHAPASSTRCQVAMDARRNEVFTGEYEISGALPTLVSESLLTLDELVQQVSTVGQGQETLTPEASVKEYVRSCVQDVDVMLVVRPDASTIARLGFKKIRAGLTVSPEQLDATYIRRSDAEVTKIAQARRS